MAMKRSERVEASKEIDRKIDDVANNDAPEIIVHHYDSKIAADHKLAERKLSKYNFTLFQDYDEELIRQSFAKATRHKSLATIINLSEFHGKDWSDITRVEIRTILTKIMTVYSKKTGQETNTTYDHKKHLRLFVRWIVTGVRERDKNEAELDVLKDVRMRKVKNQLVREELLNDDDMMKLSEACGEDIMMRALIWTAYDAGTRPTELLTLRIKDIKQESDGWTISVDGKTGQRPIHLIKSVPYLTTWLNCHPLKKRTDWALFVITYRNFYGNPLSYVTCNKRLKEIGIKANLSKRLYLNLFRHSEVTNTSKFMPESLLKKRHGWTATSKVPANYQHMVQDDVKKSLHEHYGITTTEEKPVINQKCSNCEEVNGLDVDLCVRCHLPLSLEKRMELQDKDDQEKQRINDKLEKSDTKIDKLTEIIKNLSKKIDEKSS